MEKEQPKIVCIVTENGSSSYYVDGKKVSKEEYDIAGGGEWRCNKPVDPDKYHEIKFK